MRVVGDEIWYGTLEDGLVMGNRGGWRTLDIADGLPSNDVTAVLPLEGGRVLVATRGGLAEVSR
jgi:ligand-binding sensor domain-containing protein